MTITVYGYELWQCGLALWLAGSLVSAFVGGVLLEDDVMGALVIAILWPFFVVVCVLGGLAYLAASPFMALYLCGYWVGMRFSKPGVARPDGPPVEDDDEP